MVNKEKVLLDLATGRAFKFVLAGILLGYSDESIVYYMRKRFDQEFVSDEYYDRLFTGTGLIRAPEEREIEGQVILSRIAANRIIPHPFPHGSRYLTDWSNVEKHLDDPRLLKRYTLIYPKVSLYVKRTTL